MYRIDPAVFGGMFALPVRLADEALAMASGSFLKAIVYVFRHADTPPEPSAVAAGAGIPEAEAADALAYWAEKGFLLTEEARTEEEPAAVKEQAVSEGPAGKPEREILSVKPQKPTYEMICARIRESEAVRELFADAQLRLGRTIGTGDQASLLLLHDYYGLPVEIILTICQYAATHGKANNIHYIYTVGVDWSRREIDTLELADEEFRRLERLDSRWESFRRQTGIKNARPTAPQKKYLDVWTGEWQFSEEMLVAAFEEMSKNTDTVSFPYMHKILAKWHTAGIRTRAEAEAAEKRFQEQKDAAAAKRAGKSAYGTGAPAAAAADRQPASYDINKAMDRMKTTVPTLKKKEKR